MSGGTTAQEPHGDQLRSALSALANAEAIPTDAPSGTASEIGSGVSVGAGATEAPRRDLTPGQVEEIVRAEATERRHAAEEYATWAARLRAEAAVLDSFLGVA